MKIGTLAKQNILIECKSHKSGSLRQKTEKIKRKKNDIVLKRQRCMSGSYKKARHFLFAGRSFHTQTTCG
jgi:hypothetical protein